MAVSCGMCAVGCAYFLKSAHKEINIQLKKLFK